MIGIDRRLRSRVVDQLKDAVVTRSQPAYAEVRDQLERFVEDARLAYTAFESAAAAGMWFVLLKQSPRCSQSNSY